MTAPELTPADLAYSEGSWCGECRYGVVEDPPCCTVPPAPELSETEAARVAAFETAPAAPESYVQQHKINDTGDCFCNPRQVGTLGIWDHNMGELCPECGDMHDVAACAAASASCDCCESIFKAKGA